MKIYLQDTYTVTLLERGCSDPLNTQEVELINLSLLVLSIGISGSKRGGTSSIGCVLKVFIKRLIPVFARRCCRPSELDGYHLFGQGGRQKEIAWPSLEKLLRKENV